MREYAHVSQDAQFVDGRKTRQDDAITAEGADVHGLPVERDLRHGRRGQLDEVSMRPAGPN